MNIGEEDDEDSHSYTFLIFPPDARYVGDTINTTAEPLARYTVC